MGSIQLETELGHLLGEIMAGIRSTTLLGELQEFLDALPTRPCPENPASPDFCTVCKRLNHLVASRCQFSGLELAAEKASEISEREEAPEKIEFKPVTDEVETKQVVPSNTDEDFPMIEIVKPAKAPRKPVEMELLEDVAIEFEILGDDDEPIEVEPLEVEPLEDDDNDEEYETLEFQAVGDDENDDVVEVAEAPELVFEPMASAAEAPSSSGLPSAPIPAPILTIRPVQKPRVPKRGVRLKGRKASLKRRPLKKQAPEFQPIIEPIPEPIPAPIVPQPQIAPRVKPKQKPQISSKLKHRVKQAPRIVKPKRNIKKD